MTDIKKTSESKESERSKKLQLNKETLKDLTAGNTGQVKGGQARTTMNGDGTRCSGGAEC